MSFRRSVLAVLFSTLTFSSVASAELTQVEAGKFKVDASAVKRTIKWEGKGGKVEVAVDADKYTFTGTLTALDMGDEERTKHAKQDFKYGKFPTAKLEVDKKAVKVPAKDKEATEGTVQGKLTFLGKSRSVPVTYKAVREGSHVVVKAHFEFDYTDFRRIKKDDKDEPDPICRFKGTICVDPKVKISVFGLKLGDK
jgi:polyisoprenoid-binding protein YceI